MNILITGANGFVGKNLVAALTNVKEGKDRTRGDLLIEELYLYDIDSPSELLETACEKADFVFHLAGVNRAQDPEDFVKGNCLFTEKLLKTLEKYNNNCKVMLSSSVQATLVGRYDSPYGRSKRACEELVFAHAEKCGADALVYRLPNLFGKWCKPNYNSVVATFCSNIANSLPINISDPEISLELLYIDDLVEELIGALAGKEHRCETCNGEAHPYENGSFCASPVTHKVTLGEIAGLLRDFEEKSRALFVPDMPDGSFEKKLYATYLSYLPEDKIKLDLKMNVDSRGSFTEVVKTLSCGQFSVNISEPGITKGQHWHHTKWEIFVVVSGHGLIRMRRIGSDEINEFEVSGDKLEAIRMIPGYTHSVVNLSDSEKLVTLIWANENFDPDRPDTFFEALDK